MLPLGPDPGERGSRDGVGGGWGVGGSANALGGFRPREGASFSPQSAKSKVESARGGESYFGTAPAPRPSQHACPKPLCWSLWLHEKKVSPSQKPCSHIGRRCFQPRMTRGRTRHSTQSTSVCFPAINECLQWSDVRGMKWVCLGSNMCSCSTKGSWSFLCISAKAWEVQPGQQRWKVVVAIIIKRQCVGRGGGGMRSGGAQGHVCVGGGGSQSGGHNQSPHDW